MCLSYSRRILEDEQVINTRSLVYRLTHILHICMYVMVHAHSYVSFNMLIQPNLVMRNCSCTLPEQWTLLQSIVWKERRKTRKTLSREEVDVFLLHKGLWTDSLPPWNVPTISERLPVCIASLFSRHHHYESIPGLFQGIWSESVNLKSPYWLRDCSLWKVWNREASLRLNLLLDKSSLLAVHEHIRQVVSRRSHAE